MISKLPEISGPAWPEIGKFHFWLRSGVSTLPPTFVYHYGLLARDRGQMVSVESDSILGGVKWVPCEEVEGLAALAWAAYERGEVFLVQRKHGDMWYEYLAVRRVGRPRN